MSVKSPLGSRLFRSPEGWLFIMAILVRMLILSRFAASPHFLPDTDDMHFYKEWALRIGRGVWTDGHAFYGLPGYAFCLAAIFAVCGFNPLVVATIQIVFEALTTVVVFKTAKAGLSDSQSQESEPQTATAAAVLASLGWIFYQPAQTFSSILMPTAWVVLAFWGCVWWTLKTRVSPPWWSWLVLGIIAGAMAMMVATILFLMPLFLFSIARTVGRSKATARRIPMIAAATALLAAGTFIGAAPAWIHNYFIARDPVLLSAHSGLNFWMGNNPDANGYPKIPDGLSAGQAGLLRDSITRAEEAAGHPLKRSEVSKFWSAKADAWVRENRGAWVALNVTKLRNFWNAFQYDDLSEINLLRDEGVLPPGLRFGIVAAFGLPGMLFALWRLPRSRWIAAAVLLHMCALLPVFITERYRLCAVPGLMIFAAFGICEIWGSLARGRWLSAGTLLIALTGSTWFVTLPVRDPNLWALDPYNTGLKELRVGNLDLAQRKLEAAHALAPDSAEVNFGLGNLWLERKDARARAFYQRTIALAPRHTGALTNLGRLETLSRNWTAAEELLRASIAVDPVAIRPRLFLAEMKYASGDVPGARVALAEALVIKPDQRELLEFQAKLPPP